jgi:hypothetical protein
MIDQWTEVIVAYRTLWQVGVYHPLSIRITYDFYVSKLQCIIIIMLTIFIQKERVREDERLDPENPQS